MTTQHRSVRAFTLIELLVVIAIIAIVAGLVVGLSGVTSEKKKISRAQVERDRLVTLIEDYKAKVGVYPPDNPNNAGRNTLLYELAGAIRDTRNPGNPTYITPIANITPLGNVQASVLIASFGVNGIQNAVDIGGETNQVHRLLKSVKPDQMGTVAPGTISLVVPIDDWNGQQPNPWNYLRGDNAAHNKDSFDLWVNIKMGRKTNVIGNWKE